MNRSPKLQNQKARIRLLEAELDKRDRLIGVLREGHNIQSAILEKSLVGYYIVSDGKFRLMNPIVMSYTGYLADELINKKANFLIHSEDKEKVKKYRHAMLGGKQTTPYEYRIISKQKETLWVMEVVASIVFEGKQAILANAMDITNRKVTEQTLIESENLYRTIFEATGTMASIIGGDKTLLKVNSEFERVTGYPKEEWEGKKKWTELVLKKDRPRLVKYHRLRRTNPDSVPRSYEYHLINKQGEIRNVLSTVSLIPGSKKYISSAIDITELKKAEEQLIRQSENLKELNAALKVLLKQRENDKKELEASILSNIKELVLPYIEKIRQTDLDKNHQTYLDLLESNLKNILSPFSHTISAQYMSLTSREIEVANFIKAGRNSKEIAALLNISSRCVDIHRYHIRKKLGLNNKHANLRAFLSSLSSNL
jgi:PAS domain S-box-containing protein